MLDLDNIREGQQKIRQHVASGDKLQLLRIDEHRSILHWQGDGIEHIPNQRIVMCQNGGNQFTAVKQGDEYIFTKGWYQMDPEDWRETAFRRKRLLDLIRLSTFKPPSISYVPKAFCHPAVRDVIFGEHILGIKMHKSDENNQWNFALVYREGKADQQTSPVWGGKPWESIPAKEWCANLPKKPPLPFKKFEVETMQDVVKEEIAELEERADWGLF